MKTLHAKRGLRSNDGSALVEAALLLPVLLVLMLNAVNFGVYIYAWVTVNDAARAAAEYASYNGVALDFVGQPAFSQIQAVVNSTAISLPHYVAGAGGVGNPTLKVCSNASSVQTCTGSGAAAAQADPEPTLHNLWTADVAYTFTPILSGSIAGISLTIPATTIHRQVSMRSLQ